jgi:hypothetical protein
MRFCTDRIVTAEQAAAILAALRRTDAFANVCIDAAAGRLRISGAMSANEAAAALRESGCEALRDSEFETDADGCCGGCA